ncbi:thermonuclease family protein [Neisseria sp. Ec49-e6-T10]|uniref:thermonuclease family protein n=1 Tax=Neisseria sp. Ec49-e6-T10 TaxID=3140744 RepID=UPI003EBCDD3C
MKKRILFSLLFLSFAQAETIQCKVTNVIDSNNIVCKKANNEPVEVKLYQIDAPDLGQAFSQEAKHSLTSHYLNRHIDIETHGIDKYQRTLGTIYTMNMCSCYPEGDPMNVSDDCGCKFDRNLSMIQQGHAWFDKSYGENPEYQQAQEEAKQAKRGLWADTNPIPPWEWRK